MTQAEATLEVIETCVEAGKLEYIPLVMCHLGGYAPADLLPEGLLSECDRLNLEILKGPSKDSEQEPRKNRG